MIVTKLFSKKPWFLAIWLVGFLFMASNLLLGSLYQERIYPGVKVGATPLGGLTRAEALQALEAQSRAYHLVLQVDGKKHYLKPSDIGASYDVSLTLDQAFNAGRGAVIPIIGMITAGREEPLTFSYTVDRSVMTSFVSTFVSEQTAAPVDASVVVTNGVPSVLPDKNGLGINKLALVEVLQNSVTAQLEKVSVERGPVPADVTASAATAAADSSKKLINTVLNLTYNGKQFTPTPAQIGSWLVFTKQDNGTLVPQINQEAVKGYLASIAASIEVAPVAKQINVVNGQVQSEDGGTAGTAIDKDSLAPQIATAILAGQPATLAVPTVQVAYKTIYNRTITLDAAQYIEVNLSTQHLWAYQDHQVIFDSPVTSGAAGYGFSTVTGLFSIYAKQTDRYLDGRPLGYNYNVFVQYWMPFYADYGLHDAPWRNGNFGGQDYYYGGSHGCVNLPTATAAWLYGWSSVGTPVWVHL